jgi:AmmeMemoRadiSam system protein A
VLLALARSAITAALAGRQPPPIPNRPAATLHRGAFVTLEDGEQHELRGCVGHVEPDRPLGEVIRQVAVSAARSDPRFPPVTDGELHALRIEISVLSEPVRVDPVAPERIVVGRDGLLVRRGRVQGVLLPQVASEHGFGAEAFLRAACQKAGLPAASWQEPGTQIFTFTADILAE